MSLIENIGPVLRTSRNAIEGTRRAKDFASRGVIEAFEVGCFSIFYSYLTGHTPSPDSISSACLMQDLFERFNRHGDENTRNLNNFDPYWENDHFAEEFAGLSTKIVIDLQKKYGQEEGLKRADNILAKIDDYLLVTTTVEEWMTGRKSYSDFNEKEKCALGNIPFVGKEQLTAQYRLHNDSYWLKSLVTTISDGDEKLVEESFESLLSGTMLFQLTDDYVNVKRNRKVGRSAFFVGHYKDGSTIKDVRNALQVAEPYFKGLGLSTPSTNLIKTAWIARSIIGRSKMDKRSDNHYGNDDLFQEINDFEANVERILYNGNSKKKQ